MGAWILAGTGVVVATVGWIVVAIYRRRTWTLVAKDPWALRYSLPILFVGAIAAAGAFLWAYRSIEGNDKDRADVGLKAATATAAVAAGILTWGRLELSRREHRLATDQDLTERYGRAVEQLGNESPVIRAGGAFALERFALDAFVQGGRGKDADWRMALDLLTGFIRQERPARPDKEGEPMTPLPLTVDVAAALRVVGRFSLRAKLDELPGCDLQRIDLVGADLAGCEFVSVNLARANFTDADLAKANLTEAILVEANLTDASLLEAHLNRVHLSRAKLTHAWLLAAHLKGAHLRDANLTEAILVEADLTFANLTDAKLTRANLTDANLTDANLTRTDLTGANLTDANLTRANLTFANLTDAKLTRTDLTDADLTHARLPAANPKGAG